ncbi:Integrase catalytic domain-containing protein, partial [Aphis craccivora]
LWTLFCEKEPKKTTKEDIENYYNILRTTGVHLKKDGKPKTSRSPQINLTPIKDQLSSSNAKRSHVKDDTTMKNEPFYFNPEANSSMVTDPAVENMFNFTLTPQPKIARKIFPRRSVVTRFIDDLWQADLMDMQSHSRQNYCFRYILVVIDTYSKYVWVEALKNKTSNECTNRRPRE